VADVEDCRAAATFLHHSGRVDGHRMVVKGSSAGGLTALLCLDTGGPFAAAVVSYGVTDLEALAADTHKFESRYLDRLVGPWPEAEEVYRDRSPARHPERVEGAVLLLQGADDPIVPPDQAERMVAALRARQLRCDYVVFAGEGHGFRRAETLTRGAQLEIAFVLDVLGITPDEDTGKAGKA
jgi:dipeptidyl aminopeptidase/acylaminoacyl peptidase